MAAPLTAAEARALLRKRATLRRAASKAAQAAKADARARRVLEMLEEGLTYVDIAEELGVKVTTIPGVIKRARKRLAKPV